MIMNDVLSGTGWGEVPEKELDIPWFMLSDYRREERRLADEQEAEIAAAVGRERRKLRAKAKVEKQERKNFKIGLALVPAVSLMLMLTAYVVEVIV